MEETPRKNKRIISDMVAPSKKKPIMSDTQLKEKNFSRSEIVQPKPIKHIQNIPTHSDYAEKIIEENYEDMENLEEDYSPVESSRLQNIDMDSVMRQSRNYGGCLLWFISIICAIAIILGIGGLFAHAQVTITQKTWTGQVSQNIILAQNPSPGQIAFATETQTFTDAVVIPATGTSSTSSKATGIVRFYNATSSAKTIPTGTILLSSKNISYATMKKITIPAQKGKIPGQIDAKVTASAVGSDANDGPDDFTFSSAKNFAGITAHSTTSLSGGSSANTQTADPVSVSAAEVQIAQYFTDPAVFITRMQNEIPDTMIVLPIQIVPAAPTITTDGTQTDGVHVDGSESITILLVSKSDIANTLGTTLQVPQNVKITLPSFNNIMVTTATALAANAVPQTMTIHAAGNATVIGSIDPKKVKVAMIGITRKQARAILDITPEIQTYTIKLAPFWRHIFPTNPSKISITIK